MTNPQDIKRRGAGPTPGDVSSFLPEGAFVVQFRTGAATLDGPLAGRVEHVVSGRAAHFNTQAELLAFLRDALRFLLPRTLVPETHTTPEQPGPQRKSRFR